MKINKTEKKIIIGSVLATVLMVAGFTLAQGNLKSKEDDYTPLNETVSMDKYKVNEDEYEIVSKEEETQTYIVHAKREFNSKEMAYITSQLIQNNENMNEEYEIYMFDEIESAQNFDGTTDSMQIKIKPITNNEIQIQQYHEAEAAQDIAPIDYEIQNIEEMEEGTKVEMIINNLNDPNEALAQIQFIGTVLRNENQDKNLGTLNIIAYTDDKKQESFEYHGEYKTKIINNINEKLK